MRTRGSFSAHSKDRMIRLLTVSGRDQGRLFAAARAARAKYFKKQVEVRSVIEYANRCRQRCHYCGMRWGSGLKRYTLDRDQVIETAVRLYRAGRRVIMIQAGEYGGHRYLADLQDTVRSVMKKLSGLTLIAACGSLSEDQYRKLRDSGIQRYVLKFETSDPRLYKKLKPADSLRNRIGHILLLKKLGFAVSSGNITGLPGQTLGSLADDIALLRELDIPMGSTSVFVPNRRSPYAAHPAGDIGLALNVMAVLRLSCPSMLIPSTSALETISRNGQYKGLLAGANTITLHDGTPAGAEEKFIIYDRERCKPREELFALVRAAGLVCSRQPLI